MSDQLVLLERPIPGVAVIRFNRPDARNAINLAMQAQVDALLVALEADEAVRAIVFAGAGDQAFSAGYDVREMQAFDRDQLLLAQLRREPWLWRIASYGKPLLGAINGFAHGAGAIIAASLDIRVGGPQAEFRFTATSYGGANNTWQLPPVVGFAKAKEFLLTARRIGAEEALQAGLLNHVVAAEAVLERTLQIAAEIAAHPPEAVRQTKALIHANLGRSYEAAYRAENAVMMNELAPRPPAEIFEKFPGKRRSDG